MGMMESLMNYGVNTHKFEIQDLDVNDRLALEDQINFARRKYAELIGVLDDVQQKMVENNKSLSERSTFLSEKAINEGTPVSKLINADSEYQTYDAKQVAFKTGLNIVTEQMDFYKNDLRILNSVFYNKF